MKIITLPQTNYIPNWWRSIDGKGSDKITRTGLEKINDILARKAGNQILEPLPKVDNLIRMRNIRKVNVRQEQELREESGVILNDPYSQNKNRKLIAYFRGSQIEIFSAYEVKQIMHFLLQYIEGGYSELFDSFFVVYRCAYEEHLYEFRNNQLLHQGDDFTILTSIYANTIHFSDGSPEETIGTIPIVGTVPLSRIANSAHPYVHLPLFYPACSLGGKYRRHSNSQNIFPNFYKIFSMVLETVKKTEELMIKASR